MIDQATAILSAVISLGIISATGLSGWATTRDGLYPDLYKDGVKETAVLAIFAIISIAVTARLAWLGWTVT